VPSLVGFARRTGGRPAGEAAGALARTGGTGELDTPAVKSETEAERGDPSTVDWKEVGEPDDQGRSCFVAEASDSPSCGHSYEISPDKAAQGDAFECFSIAEIGGRKGRAGPWKGTLEELKKRVENDVRERRYWAARRDEELEMKRVAAALKTTGSGNGTDPAASAKEMSEQLAALAGDDDAPELPPDLVWEDTEDRFIRRAPEGAGEAGPAALNTPCQAAAVVAAGTDVAVFSPTIL
jgi:hypothetical protein